MGNVIFCGVLSLRSKISKITGKIGLMFCKLTFYVGKQANYLQIYLSTSEITKF